MSTITAAHSEIAYSCISDMGCRGVCSADVQMAIPNTATGAGPSVTTPAWKLSRRMPAKKRSSWRPVAWLPSPATWQKPSPRPKPVPTKMTQPRRSSFYNGPGRCHDGSKRNALGSVISNLKFNIACRPPSVPGSCRSYSRLD